MEAENVEHKKEMKKVPQLRFSGFEGEWYRIKLKDIASVKRGAGSQYLRYVNNPNEGVRLIRIGDFLGSEPVFVEDNDDIKRFKLNKGDILIAGTGATAGITFLVPDEFVDLAYSYNAPKIMVLKGDQKFVIYYLKSDLILSQQKRLFTGNAQPFLDTKAIGNFQLSKPTLPEQQKISAFLSAVDQKIKQLTRKKELLEQYKKGVMQKIFSREIRFKDKNGKGYPDWEEKQLGDLAIRITTKNQKSFVTFVLTNSATEGVVSQQDYFDKDIANQNNLEGYYIVDKGDFVYNPRISSSAPVGPIKRNKLEKGVMSPLYTVFRFDAENLDYFEYFFETTVWHKYMHSIANFGARYDRMNITNIDFLKMPIPYPCEEERDKICLFLTNLTKELDSAKARLVQTQQFRKGLLQQMFV